MKYLYDSWRVSKNACIATLPDGEMVVGCGKEWMNYFPMENIGKYLALWAQWTQEAQDELDADKLKWNTTRTYLNIRPTLNFLASKNVWVYKANLKLQSFRKGDRANDKVFWIDADTGAHYSMDVADMYEMVNGFAEWIVTVNPITWIITADVFPNTRWGTTFLSVFTKEMRGAIQSVNDAAAKRKTEKLKPKQFIVGHVYSTSLTWDDTQYYKEIYLWPGYARWMNTLECNIFINLRSYGNHWKTEEYCFVTVRKGMITAYKDLGNHELDVSALVEKANRISPQTFITLSQ